MRAGWVGGRAKSIVTPTHLFLRPDTFILRKISSDRHDQLPAGLLNVQPPESRSLLARKCKKKIKQGRTRCWWTKQRLYLNQSAASAGNTKTPCFAASVNDICKAWRETPQPTALVPAPLKAQQARTHPKQLLLQEGTATCGRQRTDVLINFFQRGYVPAICTSATLQLWTQEIIT